jgi:uncharacterized integral membrane protein
MNTVHSPDEDSLSIDESRWWWVLLLLLWWLLLFIFTVSCDDAVKFEWWDKWLDVGGKAYILRPN